MHMSSQILIRSDVEGSDYAHLLSIFGGCMGTENGCPAVGSSRQYVEHTNVSCEYRHVSLESCTRTGNHTKPVITLATTPVQ